MPAADQKETAGGLPFVGGGLLRKIDAYRGRNMTPERLFRQTLLVGGTRTNPRGP